MIPNDGTVAQFAVRPYAHLIETAPWQARHRSTPTDEMQNAAPGPRPRPARPAPSSMRSRTARTPKPYAPSCHRKTPSSSTSASTNGSTTSTRATTPNAELVIDAAELAWTIDRTKRCETARLAERVRQAMLKAEAAADKEVGELGRRLLYNTEAKPLPTPGRRWEDNPAAFLEGLESSAEGCRWLLDHWMALRVLLDRNSAWTYGDMFRLVRLLGKYPVEAINDPKLNAIFLAWDVLVPGWAERFWKECKKCKPLHDPGFSDFGRWREIAERPADAAAAIKFFETADGRASGPAGGAAGSCTRRSPATMPPSWPTGCRSMACRRRAAAAVSRRREPRAAADAGALDEDAEERESRSCGRRRWHDER